MSTQMEITPAGMADVPEVAAMVGELLAEIMRVTGTPAFRFDLDETSRRLEDFLARGRYWVYVARDGEPAAGFIALCESHALYAEGAFGTIPELYVRPAWRSRSCGAALVGAATTHGRNCGWTRLEVTTPSIPEFARTLAFYEREGFSVSGGRKLKLPL